ncbi:transcription factor Jun-like [Lycorma delicatula]|uniref:transcription factor Jun-like n=1 Tax=Lycorma delicatula TaxID=130591 RepID=UPI003F516B34
MVRNTTAPRMETTFYEEQSFHQKLCDVNQLKRTLTLDLNSTRTGAKRAKLCGVPVLSSPDLNKLKLGSPDLERFLISNNSNSLVTPTPTTTQQILFPAKVTEEQESYARGFVDALNELHHSDSSQGAVQQVELPRSSSSSSSSGATYMTLDSQFTNGFASELGIIVKDEPQTVPSLGSTPPLSPINMECQERIKLERKRQRNRVAASKCRRRKLERIARLEDKVKLLKGENTELSGVVNKLKEQVCQLKEQVMDHVHSGCQIMLSSQF